MPSKPSKVNRSWVKPRESFERPVDLSWFYNQWKWKKASKAYRLAHPLCECDECKNNEIVKPAQVCDHTKGLKFLLDNNIDPFDWNELQSMSKACHNKKSGSERGYGVKSLGPI